MAKATLNNGESGLIIRGKINDNFTELYTITPVSITAATSLTSSALGKLHTCTGTSSDYQVDLPTAVGNSEEMILIKGAAALTKVVTVVGVSGQTIDGEANRKLSSGGLFVLVSDGANWILTNEIGSWIPYTPVWAGFSADPTISYAGYFRQGKQCTLIITPAASGTSNATTLTVTAPFNAASLTIIPTLIQNNGTFATGRVQTAAGSTTLTFLAAPTGSAFTGSGSKTGYVNISYAVQ